MEITRDIGRTGIDDLLPYLKRLGLIDVGVIQSYIVSTNRASVATFQLFGGKQLVLEDVEVLLPGNAVNGFTGDLNNSPCLVIYPRSVVPSMRDGKVLWRAAAFDSQGVKCIPLSVRPDSSKIRIGFDSDGRFVISCKAYVVIISEDGITYTNEDNTLQYDISGSSDQEQVTGGGLIVTSTGKDGTYELYYKTTDGLVAYRVLYKPDGTYKVQRGAFKKWENDELGDHDLFTAYAWTTTYNMDGSVSIMLQNSDEKPLSQVDITPDGGWDFTQTNADGDVLNHVTITSAGDITIAQEKAENTITLKQDGTLDIQTKAAVTVTTKDAMTVTSEKDMTIESKANMTTKMAQKWTAGSSSVTLKSILIDDLLNNLLTNFDTVGSPGAHKTGPGAIASISQLVTKWGQLLG